MTKLTELQVDLIKRLAITAIVGQYSSSLGYGDKIIARALSKKGLLTIRKQVETVEETQNSIVVCRYRAVITRAKLTDTGASLLP